MTLLKCNFCGSTNCSRQGRKNYGRTYFKSYKCKDCKKNNKGEKIEDLYIMTQGEILGLIFQMEIEGQLSGDPRFERTKDGWALKEKYNMVTDEFFKYKKAQKGK